MKNAMIVAIVFVALCLMSASCMADIEYKCSYCGGYTVESEQESSSTSVYVYDEDTEEPVREVCIKCFVKVFDTVLGEPEEKQ